jgi:hypothetical protein
MYITATRAFSFIKKNVKKKKMYLNFSKGDRHFNDSVLSPSDNMEIRLIASLASEII